MAQFRELKLSTPDTNRADKQRTVRMNGDDSRATMRNIGTEIHDGRIRVYLQLTASIEDYSKWMRGAHVALEATWDIQDMIISVHHGLTNVIKQQVVQGEFLVRNLQPFEGWFFGELEWVEPDIRCKPGEKVGRTGQ